MQYQLVGLSFGYVQFFRALEANSGEGSGAGQRPKERESTRPRYMIIASAVGAFVAIPSRYSRALVAALNEVCVPVSSPPSGSALNLLAGGLHGATVGQLKKALLAAGVNPREIAYLRNGEIADVPTRQVEANSKGD